MDDDTSQPANTGTIKTKPKEGDLPRGVFVLPLNEMVGTYFRNEEITQLIDHVEENSLNRKCDSPIRILNEDRDEGK